MGSSYERTELRREQVQSRQIGHVVNERHFYIYGYKNIDVWRTFSLEKRDKLAVAHAKDRTHARQSTKYE